jgi:uncharacterized protein (DUF1697 family)
VVTFIRTPAEIAGLAAYRPFPGAMLDAPGSSLYVAFLGAIPGGEAQHRLLALRSAQDDFHFYQRHAFWWSRGKMSDSPLFSGPFLEKTLGMPATLRNITTVRKLAARYG